MFQSIILAIIALLATSSYVVGIRSILRGEYKPSIYSRFIWTLLTLNSFVGVLQLHNKPATIVLTGIQLAGCVGMLWATWGHSVRSIWWTERICTALLVVSIVLWVVIDKPFVNVVISLVAHFIGAVPSLAKVAKEPRSENMAFWLTFGIASLLTFATADKSLVQNYIYALYFVVFDMLMSALAARQYFVRVRPYSLAPAAGREPDC